MSTLYITAIANLALQVSCDSIYVYSLHYNLANLASQVVTPYISSPCFIYSSEIVPTSVDYSFYNQHFGGVWFEYFKFGNPGL